MIKSWIHIHMNIIGRLFILGALLILSSCNEQETTEKLRFSTSAEYPPFEYIDHGEITGFDIELAKLVAKELGKEAVFDNMKFNSVLPALNSGQTDVAIATITITEERKKNFDLSVPYYFESMAAIYKANQPVNQSSQLNSKKIAVQLGSVMEIWLKKHYPRNQITVFDNTNQAIEALLAGHVEVIFLDGVQANIFSKKHPDLAYSVIATTNTGYALAVKKGSPLIVDINFAIEKLKARGEIQKLAAIWLKS